MARPSADPGRVPIRRLMRREFISLGADEAVAEALQLMRLARLRHLLVVEELRLVGVVSYRDLQDHVVHRLEEARGSARSRVALLDVPVREIMSTSPYAVTPDTPVREAVLRLCSLRVGCLPVVEGRRPQDPLVGIVTETDLLWAAYR